MSTYATKYTAPLWASSSADPTGFLVAVPVAVVLIQRNGVNVTSYSDRTKTVLAVAGAPIPLGVAPGLPGVDTYGNLVVWLEFENGYTATVTRGGGTPTTVAISGVAPDPLEPALAVASVAAVSGLTAALAEKALVAGNPTIALGTSITISTADAAGLSRIGTSWFSWAPLLSDSQITFLRNAGVPGDSVAQMLARFQADVVAYLPQNVIIEAGSNDAYLLGTTLASFATTIKALVAAAQAANIRPFLTTVPMRDDVASALVGQYNAFLHSYAQSTGIKLIPFFETLVDPATGLSKPAYIADHLHPNGVGAHLLAQAAADAMVGDLPPWAAPLAEHQAAHSPNLVANALFLTNAGGLGTGWLIDQGIGVGSIIPAVPGVDGANFVGNWQRITRPSGGLQTVVHSPTFAVAAGQRIAFCGGFQSECGVDSASMQLYWLPGGTSVSPMLNFGGTIDPHEFYIEATAPAGTTGAAVYLVLPAGSGGGIWAQIAQPTVLNLTTLGIPALLP